MRLVGLLGVALLSGCSAISGMSVGKPPAQVSSQDGPPLRSMDVANKPLPTPVSEARIRRGNVSPYRVFGVEYEVMPSASGYQEVGTASWYGRKFHGRLTSSGEPYDMFEFTAAHKTLPIPSYLRVTNLANGQQVIVRVNDRGPFAKGRIIDLSWAAAKRIGYDTLGTARVQLEILAHPDLVETAAQPSATEFLQIASVSQRAAAESLLTATLGELGLSPAQGRVQSVTIGGVSSYRVQLGPFSAEQGEATRLNLAQRDIDAITVTN